MFCLVYDELNFLLSSSGGAAASFDIPSIVDDDDVVRRVEMLFSSPNHFLHLPPPSMINQIKCFVCLFRFVLLLYLFSIRHFSNQLMNVMHALFRIGNY